MKKLIAALIATTLVATAAVGSANQAQANDVGLGIAAGIIGGIAVGGLIASQQPRVEYDAVPVRRQVVVEDDVVCHRRLYEDAYGNRYWKRSCR